jgi:hypothetical protein
MNFSVAMAAFSGKFSFKPIHIYWLGFSFASASVEWKLRTATCTSILLTKISQRSSHHKLPHLAPLCDESQSHTDVCYCLSDCRFLGASLLLPSAFNRSVGYCIVAQSDTKNLTIRQNGQKLFNKQCYNNHIRFQLHLVDGESISLSCKILVTLGTERLNLVSLGTERLTISGHSHVLQHSL